MGVLDRLFRRFDRNRDRERFAADVIAALRAAGITDAHYRRGQFTIVIAEGTARSARLFLGNLYAECQRDPSSRPERIRRYVAAFSERDTMPATFADARGDLRAVLRHPAYGAGNPNGLPVLRRPALPFLDEMVVLDRPNHMSYVNGREAARWGVSEEEVFAAARAGLAALGEPPEADPAAGPSVIRLVDDGDAYFASRVLVGDWLAALGAHVGAPPGAATGFRPVAFAPDTSTVVVAPDEPALIAELYQRIADEYAEAPRGLSPMAYTVDDRGLVVPYAPPPAHPAFPAAEAAYRRLALDAYEGQRANLEQAGGPGTGGDGVLAECRLVRRPDGTSFTAAVWTLGDMTLLPRVDFVGLFDVSEKISFVPWGVLVESDAIVEAVQYHPARFRTPPVPTMEALGYLRERAVDP